MNRVYNRDEKEARKQEEMDALWEGLERELSFLGAVRGWMNTVALMSS